MRGLRRLRAPTSPTGQKIVVFGATGTIGKAVVAAPSPKYEVLQVGNRRCELKADFADKDSIGNVFKTIGKVDGIVSTAGAARFAPLEKLTHELALRESATTSVLWTAPEPQT